MRSVQPLLLFVLLFQLFVAAGVTAHRAPRRRSRPTPRLVRLVMFDQG